VAPPPRTDTVAAPLALLSGIALALAQPPLVGVACPTPNVTTCGRLGIAVWLERPARGATAELAGARVRLHAGGLGGRGPTYWEGYVRIDPKRLGLPPRWYGSAPARTLVVRLAIRYPRGTARGAVRVRVRPGWG
jgi:hypothetical protein